MYCVMIMIMFCAVIDQSAETTWPNEGRFEIGGGMHGIIGLIERVVVWTLFIDLMVMRFG